MNYVNDSSDDRDSNIESFVTDIYGVRVLMYCTTKEILKDNQLITNYGEDYWKRKKTTPLCNREIESSRSLPAETHLHNLEIFRDEKLNYTNNNVDKKNKHPLCYSDYSSIFYNLKIEKNNSQGSSAYDLISYDNIDKGALVGYYVGKIEDRVKYSRIKSAKIPTEERKYICVDRYCNVFSFVSEIKDAKSYHNLKLEWDSSLNKMKVIATEDIEKEEVLVLYKD